MLHDFLVGNHKNVLKAYDMCPPSSAFCVRFDLSKTGEGYHFTKKKFKI